MNAWIQIRNPWIRNPKQRRSPVERGFAFLPFLWLVNIFWFFREAFLAPAYTEQSQIKGYVWRSAVGFLFWVIVLTTWITIFQIYRPRWGALGDYLSFTIPLGTP
ncbi:gamma-secretase subunit PEN-2 isoform X1 [Arvicola amphibius]|uniref:gamma-secretase subunit PEN-2 isoform X1 n=1 Tax=Arvicola amphibius TaxID=1047088 RepID=UPI0018E37514|nr:gamma-secretase subunit PEN-2 isoform X1 [Arvicola amphibius]